MPTDRPLVFIARCARCGKAKNQHRARTLECPAGKRTATGYTRFGPGRFSAEAKTNLRSPA